MAKKTEVNSVTVRCDYCGKLIMPTDAAIPTDYVWSDGIVICKECLRNGVPNKSPRPKKGGQRPSAYKKTGE